MLDMPKSIAILYDSNSRKWRNETFFVLIICLSTNYKTLHLCCMQHFWNIYIQSIEYVLVTERCTSVSSSKTKHFFNTTTPLCSRCKHFLTFSPYKYVNDDRCADKWRDSIERDNATIAWKIAEDVAKKGNGWAAENCGRQKKGVVLSAEDQAGNVWCG